MFLEILGWADYLLRRVFITSMQVYLLVICLMLTLIFEVWFGLGFCCEEY